VRVDEPRPSPGLPVLGNDAQYVDLGLFLSVRWGSHSALRRWSNGEDRQKHRREGQPAAHLAICIGSCPRPLNRSNRGSCSFSVASRQVRAPRARPEQRGKAEDERCQPRGACDDDRGGDATTTCALGATMARALIEESADYPVARSNRPAGQIHVRPLGSEQPPAHQPAGPAAVTTASGEWGMTARQAAEAPPRPAQARSLAVHGGALDERKRWPQCLPPLSRGDCPANGRDFQCAALRALSEAARASLRL
jgi:hypothetical protein